MKKPIIISIYILALFLCYSCKEKEPSVIDRLAGDNRKYWYDLIEYPSNISDHIYGFMENELAFTYINRSFNSSQYFRDGVCYESWMQKADWGETYQLINDSTIEFNKYRTYRINYLTDEVMLLSSIYPGNDLRYKLSLHVPDELVTVKSFCDSKNLPRLDSIQPLEIKKRLTNNSSKYWYLAKIFPLEGRAYVADTAYYRGTFSFTYLDEKGNYEKYYRDNLCSPIFKYQPSENHRSGWEMLNDSTIRIGDSQDLHIQYLTNEMMILSFFSKKDDTDYYYLYLKAPDEMITAKNICNL